MKKSFNKITKLIFFSLFIFTACQSNKTPEKSKTPDAPAIETSEEILSDDKTDSSLENENKTDENKTTQEISDNNELEEIEEPLVIDFFPSYEDENISVNKTESEKQENILEEKIDDFETLEPVEEKHEIPSAENNNSISTVSQNKTDAENQGPKIQTYTEKNNQKTDSKTAQDAKSDGSQEDILDVSELEELEEMENFEEIIEPSRKITVHKNEYIDVTYPGLDWKFYGASDSTKDIALIERKQYKTGTKFTLFAKNPGTKLLRFYKKDILTGSYIDDYIEVTVDDDNDSTIELNDEPESETQTSKNITPKHTDSGKYKSIANPKKLVPKKQLESTDLQEDSISETKSETKTEAKPESQDNKQKNVQSPQKKSDESVLEQPSIPLPQTSQKVQKVQKVQNVEQKKAEPQQVEPKKTEPQQAAPQQTEQKQIDASSLLDEAKKLFEGKKYNESLEKVQEFLGISKDRKDEALYLQGQLYESSSEIKNIKKSLNAYETLIKNYPSSKFWDNANKRIIYLKRFYMEGR